jgi:hypothetical protein
MMAGKPEGENMKIKFCGDRKSRTVRVGCWLRRAIGRRFVLISLWDGYKSWVEIEFGKAGRVTLI